MDSNYYRETQHSSSVATAHPACRVLTHANRQISLAPFLLCTCTVVLYMKRKQKRWRGWETTQQEAKTKLDTQGSLRAATHVFSPNTPAAELSWSKQIFLVLLKPAVCLPSHNYSDTHTWAQVPVTSCLREVTVSISHLMDVGCAF